MGLFDKMEKRIKEMTPKTGFNVVGVDKFEQPGEELYLVSHHARRVDAEKAKKAAKQKNPADDFHVYP